MTLQGSSSVLITKAKQMMKTAHLARWEEGGIGSNRQTSKVRRMGDRNSCWTSEFFLICHFFLLQLLLALSCLLASSQKWNIYGSPGFYLLLITLPAACSASTAVIAATTAVRPPLPPASTTPTASSSLFVWRAKSIYARAGSSFSFSSSSSPPPFLLPTHTARQEEEQNGEMEK